MTIVNLVSLATISIVNPNPYPHLDNYGKP